VSLSLALAFSVAEAMAQSRITQVLNADRMTVVEGNVHHFAKPEFDQGRVDGSVKIQWVTLVFKPSYRQQKALETLLAQQQDRSSPNYHKWLTPEQYSNRFGMTQSDVVKVVSWLQSQGFTVNRVSRGRTQISFTGTVGQIESVFRTEIHHYLVDGEPHFANATDLSVPTALSDVVLGFRNLNDFRPKPRDSRLRKISPVEVSSHFTSNLSGKHFLAPDDFATIYDLKALYDSGLNGSGQKLAIVGQTAIDTTDIDAFRSASGLSKNDPQLVLVPNSGTSTIQASDIGEADLDLEWSGAIAKNASIIFVYVGNNPNYSVWDSLQYAIDQKLAPVISMSYGNCELNFSSADISTLRAMAQQANSQGQTITSASGDSGAADCDYQAISATQGLAVDVPASFPEVTGVGGSEYSADVGNPNAYWNSSNNSNNGSAISYIPETTWNDTAYDLAHGGYIAAGGGGASTVFSKPSWQTGTGVPNDGHRDVPDISLNASADHDGYLVCSQGSCVNGFRYTDNSLTVFGGTSLGAPTFAGVLAIVNQATQSKGLGNVNSTLYSLVASNPSTFHDITTGNNEVPCTKGSTDCPNGGQIGYSAGTGYDQASGLGSIDAHNLVIAWPGYTPGPDYSVSASPASVTISAAGQTATSTLTISGTNGFSGVVSLSCTPPSSTTAEISCSISPSSVTLDNSTTSSTATLRISTTAPHATRDPFAVAGLGGGFTRFKQSGMVLLFSFAMLSFTLRHRRRTALQGILLLSLVVVPGCGGNSNRGTPAGSYSLTITGSNKSGTSHSTNLSLTVQ
jgi:subtilase family serine protease